VNAKDQLRDRTLRIADLVVVADRAFYLIRRIGESSPDLNARGFGEACGFLQRCLADSYTLAITKLFERRSSRNPIRSIPECLDFIRKNVPDLNIVEREQVLRVARRIIDPTISSSVSADALTERILDHFTVTMPDVANSESCELSATLASMRATRDKVIAHPEFVRELPAIAWEDSRKLVSYSQSFLAVVGWAFVSMAFELDGQYILTQDARRTERSLERLLERALA